MTTESLKAPMPYFGGKARIAPLVWARLGDVPNFVEPFFGSGAVLLARPDTHAWWDRIETVNDLDGMIANFWRSVQHDPEAVARSADWPVNENDLHARHAWLLGQRARIVARLEGDPDYHDPKVAGWWLWGICIWIGAGWCAGVGPWQSIDGELVQTERDDGTWRQLPHLGDSGQGHVAAWTDHLIDTMQRLSDRLRRVRVCSGDWSRVCGPMPTVRQGLTGVFLDPPYDQDERDGSLYVHDSPVSADVRAWAIANGDNPLLRIALCGYEGEHEMPDTWESVAWKANGGYGSQGRQRGRANAHREMIWFSPYCLKVDRPVQGTFDFAAAAGGAG